MDIDVEHVTRAWQSKWPDSILTGVDNFNPDLWVRFHGLPGSKRYPESEAEYTMILGRYNTVLQDLIPGKDVYVVISDWSDSPRPDSLGQEMQLVAPDAVYWRTVDESDPENPSYRHLYVEVREWHVGSLDGILKAVADDKISGVFMTPTSMDWLFMPYDGGVDIMVSSEQKRDELKDAHHEWLAQEPNGL